MITAQQRPANYALVGTGSASGALTLVVPAPPTGSALINTISSLTVGWTAAAPAAGTEIQIWDGPASTGILLFDGYIGNGAAALGSNQWTWPNPLRSSSGNALTVVAAAGGTGLIWKVSISGIVLYPSDI